MPSILWTVVPLFWTCSIFVLPWQPFSPTLIALSLLCLLIFYLRKVPHRVIPWQCLCMLCLARQVWYADDAAASGSLLQLRDWWSGLLSFGHHFGYHVNASKTWFVVKEDCLASAQRIYSGMGIWVTSAGQPYLGASLGSAEDYTEKCVDKWAQGLSCLSLIAGIQPHVAYTTFVHGFSSKWNYFLWTNLNVHNFLSPSESAIHHQFLPTLVTHPLMIWSGRCLLYPYLLEV